MVRGSEGGGDVKDCELASQNLLIVLCPKIRALSVGSVALFDWICVFLAFVRYLCVGPSRCFYFRVV